jgi:hypothetical protein
MPKILPNEQYEPLSLDEIRESPGRLFTRRDLARLGVVKTYSGARRLIELGALPEPYRVSGREFWEGRAILKLFAEPPALEL